MGFPLNQTLYAAVHNGEIVVDEGRPVISLTWAALNVYDGTDVDIVRVAIVLNDYWYVATLSQYELVRAPTESAARHMGEQKFGDRLRIVRPATEEEVELTNFHRQKVAEEAVRPLTDGEKLEVCKAMIQHGAAVNPDDVEFTACFPNYTTDSPGYRGPVYVVVWGGSPTAVTVLTRPRHGEMEVVVDHGV